MSDAIPVPASESGHDPVLVDEVVAVCEQLGSDAVLVDATVGLGGHTAAVCERNPRLRVVGIDRDHDAVMIAAQRLARLADRVHLLHSSASTVLRAWSSHHEQVSEPAGGDAGENVQPHSEQVHSQLDASLLSNALLSHAPAEVFENVGSTSFLFDLGVSSLQLDRGERGFSYRHDGPLDMRMDRSGTVSAATVVNEYEEAALATVLARFGDERFARRIARSIVAARPLTTTVELAQVVTQAIPAATRRTGGHPARRTFQAIRMEVNDELAELAAVLACAVELADPGGLLIVIAYHSGEDRLVKRAMTHAVTGGCQCPPRLPCGCGATPRARWCVRRRFPSAEEKARNPRARSAVLRAISFDLGEGSDPPAARPGTAREARAAATRSVS